MKTKRGGRAKVKLKPDDLTFGVTVKKCSECERNQDKGVHVLYLCDQKQCKNCSYPECRHTTDVAHAKNFHYVMDMGEEGLMFEENGGYEELVAEYADKFDRVNVISPEELRKALEFAEKRRGE